MKRKFAIWVCLIMATLVCACSVHADDMLNELQRIFGDNEHLEMTDVNPDPRDLSIDEAVSLSRDILAIGYHMSDADLEQYTVNARFVYYHEYMMGWEPVWYIRYESASDPLNLHRMLYTYDGILLGHAGPGEDFSMPYLFREKPWTPADTDNQEGAFFFDWSVEEKAAFSNKWIPIVEQYCKNNYYYTGKGDSMYAATRYTYGLPGEDDLSVEEVLDIVKKEALANGITEESFERRRKAMSFDITTPDAPKWKIWPHRVYTNDDFEFFEDDVPQFYIELDARTGEVLSVDMNPAPHGRY